MWRLLFWLLGVQITIHWWSTSQSPEDMFNNKGNLNSKLVGTLMRSAWKLLEKPGQFPFSEVVLCSQPVESYNTANKPCLGGVQKNSATLIRLLPRKLGSLKLCNAVLTQPMGIILNCSKMRLTICWKWRIFSGNREQNDTGFAKGIAIPNSSMLGLITDEKLIKLSLSLMNWGCDGQNPKMWTGCLLIIFNLCTLQLHLQVLRPTLVGCLLGSQRL